MERRYCYIDCFLIGIMLFSINQVRTRPEKIWNKRDGVPDTLEVGWDAQLSIEFSPLDPDSRVLLVYGGWESMR